MEFYRYNYYEEGSVYDEEPFSLKRYPNVKIHLALFYLVKETEKGYWIRHQYDSINFKRWVSKTAKKRFAYPTKEEALNNLIIRTKRRLDYLEHDINACRKVLILAENEKVNPKL